MIDSIDFTGELSIGLSPQLSDSNLINNSKRCYNRELFPHKHFTFVTIFREVRASLHT